MALGRFIFSYEKIPHAQKSANAQKETFFILDVLYAQKAQKAQKAQDAKQATSSS